MTSHGLTPSQCVGTFPVQDCTPNVAGSTYGGTCIGLATPTSYQKVRKNFDIQHLHDDKILKDISMHIQIGEIVGLAGIEGLDNLLYFRR